MQQKGVNITPQFCQTIKEKTSNYNDFIAQNLLKEKH